MTNLFKRYDIVIIFCLLLAAGGILSPSFFAVNNIATIMKLSGILGIATVGETLVLLTKGIDLSVGAVMGLTSILFAVLLTPYGFIPAFVISLFICSIIGFINGLFITKANIPPFITTLGMMWLLRGLAGALTHGRIIPIFEKSFTNIASASLWGLIPYFFLGLVIIGSLTHFVLSQARIGLHVYAVGGNEEASYYTGISVERIKLSIYTIAALLYGVAGLLLSSFVRSGMPFAAEGYNFRAITAAALGGVALTGGEGKLWRALLGTVILISIYSLVPSLGTSPYITGMFEGVILIGAVYICQKKRA